MTHYYYMKLDDPAQSVPQLLLSVLKILRGTVCLIKLGPQLSPLFWCHLQDSYSHLGLDVLVLQGTVEEEVSLLTTPVACPFFPPLVSLFLGERSPWFGSEGATWVPGGRWRGGALGGFLGNVLEGRRPVLFLLVGWVELGGHPLEL